VDELTLKEWRLMCKAKELQDVDRMFWLHQQAFQNFRVKAMKRAGKNRKKPVYSTFDKFFNYSRMIKKAEGEKTTDEFAAIKKYLREKEK
jgi:hypothetical protein